MIYLDSVFCIYAVESGSRQERAYELINQTHDVFAISHLVMMECLVRPYREADHVAEDRLLAFFGELAMLDAPADVYRRAAQSRAVHRSLRTPDALHLAIAQLGGCTNLWTGDADFAKISGPYVQNVFV